MPAATTASRLTTHVGPCVTAFWPHSDKPPGSACVAGSGTIGGTARLAVLGQWSGSGARPHRPVQLMPTVRRRTVRVRSEKQVLVMLC